MTSAAGGLLLALGGMAAGWALRPFARARTAITIVAALVVLLPLTTLSLSGSQMEQRFAQVGRDGGSLDLLGWSFTPNGALRGA